VKKTYDKIIAPQYVRDFLCIGEACEDTCCAGWHIPVDEETYKKYKKVKDNTIKARLEREIVAKRSNPTRDHVAKIKLKNGRCAFLSVQGLCDIYSQLGKEYLSDTCALYPRTINKVNNQWECSLICSCPEAARKILLNKDKMIWTHLEEKQRVSVVSAHITVSPDKPRKWQDYFGEIRTFIISVLQNRNYAIEERFMVLGAFMDRLEACRGPLSINKIPGLIKRYQDVMLKKQMPSDIKRISSNTAWCIALAKELQTLKTNKKIKSKRYKECLESMILGLALTPGDDVTGSCLKYEEGNRKYYTKFIDEKAYMIENYFVNYVFERCIPIDYDSPCRSFYQMHFYYELIKLHIIGMANDQEGLSDEMVVKLIQALSKTFDHDDDSFAALMKFNEEKR